MMAGKRFVRLVMILTAGIFLHVQAHANIAGSAHDFSGEGWSGGKICLPCHTPHNALLGVEGAPLWNHEITTASFTLYSSTTLVETPEQPQGVSKLCLSCHDGTVAVDSFGGAAGSSFVSGASLIGTDLSDDHPVSIQWKHQNEISSCTTCHGGMHDNNYKPPLPFYNGYVECATCHDVHNTAGYTKLLRMTLQNSALCLTCHGK